MSLHTRSVGSILPEESWCWLDRRVLPFASTAVITLAELSLCRLPFEDVLFHTLMNASTSNHGDGTFVLTQNVAAGARVQLFCRPHKFVLNASLSGMVTAL